MTEKLNTNDLVQAVPPIDDSAAATLVLLEKLADAQIPGFQAELDPDEAIAAGAFPETAISETDALDAGFDSPDHAQSSQGLRK